MCGCTSSFACSMHPEHAISAAEGRAREANAELRRKISWGLQREKDLLRCLTGYVSDVEKLRCIAESQKALNDNNMY